MAETSIYPAMTLDGVYPWGRTLDEYVGMFALTPADLRSRILSCADGPAAFNATLTARGGRVTSTDPLYQFSADEIRTRVEQTHDVLTAAAAANAHRFTWRHVPTPEALGRLRLSAMATFLSDYPAGLSAGRYVPASLPPLPFADRSFDLALCSHFLFLYSAQFDTAFHLASILEMSRLAPDVRVFPLLDLDGQPSIHLAPVLDALHGHGLDAQVVPVDFEFQKGGNRMLRVRPCRTTPC